MKFNDVVERLNLFLSEDDVQKGIKTAVNKHDINVLGELTEAQVKLCWAIDVNIDDINNRVTFRAQKQKTDSNEDIRVVSRKPTLPAKPERPLKRVNDNHDRPAKHQAIHSPSLSVSSSSDTEISDDDASTTTSCLQAQILPLKQQITECSIVNNFSREDMSN